MDWISTPFLLVLFSGLAFFVISCVFCFVLGRLMGKLDGTGYGAVGGGEPALATVAVRSEHTPVTAARQRTLLFESLPDDRDAAGSQTPTPPVFKGTLSPLAYR